MKIGSDWPHARCCPTLPPDHSAPGWFCYTLQNHPAANGSHSSPVLLPTLSSLPKEAWVETVRCVCPPGTLQDDSGCSASCWPCTSLPCLSICGLLAAQPKFLLSECTETLGSMGTVGRAGHQRMLAGAWQVAAAWPAWAQYMCSGSACQARQAPPQSLYCGQAFYTPRSFLTCTSPNFQCYAGNVFSSLKHRPQALLFMCGLVYNLHINM